MSDEYIRSKFESFIREVSKTPNFFAEISSERLFNWRDRVSAFLMEIFGEYVSMLFVNFKGVRGYSGEFAAKKRYLAWLYERYQAQKNMGVEPQNIFKDPKSTSSDIKWSAGEWGEPATEWGEPATEWGKPEEDMNEKQENRAQEKEEVKVFIVHGHENEAKEKVARFVEKLGFRTIILHEQPNKGKTIIEKFESFAEQVNFAIVLLTPDDLGAPVAEKKTPKYRARQNVIFEFGFFTAKMGRAKVCALVKGDIEIPSDYSGVIYIPIDESGAWKMALVKEMKNAGLVIDSDKLFG